MAPSSQTDLGALLRAASADLDLGRLDAADAAFGDIARAYPRSLHGWRGLALGANGRGDRAAALDYFRAARAVEPYSALTLHDLGQAFRELGRMEEAEPLLRAAVITEPRLAHGWRGLALIAKARGDADGVSANFRAALALAPEQAWPRQEMATALLELGDTDQAEAAFRDLVAHDPRRMQGWRGLGLVARQRGDPGGAAQWFQAASAVDPENLWPRTDLAAALREAGRLDEAQAVASAIVAKAANSLHGHRELGLIARLRGDRHGELAHFQAAANGDANSTLALYDLATTLAALGRRDEAEVAFRKATSINPHFSHGWRGLALLAAQRADPEEALRYFQTAADIDTDNVWLRQDMAAVLRDLGRAAEGEALLKAFLDAHPRSADACIAYANALRRHAPPAQVIALLERATAIAPAHTPAALALADAFMSVWRTDEATKLLDAVLARLPGNSQALMGKAHIARRSGARAEALPLLAAAAETSEWATSEWSRELAEAGRFAEARAVLDAALARNPWQANFHMRLGYNARLNGDHEAARVAFRAAAHLDPALDAAQVEIAVEDFFFGQINQAVDRLTATVKSRPGSTLALETFAHFAEQMDDLTSAVALMRRSLEVNGSNLWSRLRLALVLVKIGEIDEAEATIARAEAGFGLAPEIAIVRARILKDRGFYEAARALLTQAATRFPAHFELWLQRTLALIAGGAFEAAQAAFAARPSGSALEAARARLLAGELAAAQWRLDEAYAHYAAGLALDETDTWLNDCAARVALLRLDVDAAKRHLDVSVRHNASHRLINRGAAKPSQTHIGQLVDEYRIDAAALAQLRETLDAEDPPRAVAELVRAAPDYTPAAIALFVTLRRRRALSSLDAAKSCRPSPIPLRIGQFWDRSIPADIAALCDGWRDAHPDFLYRRYSLEEAQRFLDQRGPPGALAAFNRAVEPAKKADLFRLAYLFEEGGFYVDADDRCLAPLTSLDPGGRRLIVYLEDFGTLGNNFIAAVPHHPAIGIALAEAIASINQCDADIIWLSTGPALLTRSVARYFAQVGYECLDEIQVLERHELFRAVAIHTQAGYKETRNHWSRTAFRRARAHHAITEIARPETRS